MPKVLMLAHRIPYPPDKGDKIRTFNVLRQIASRHACDLACLVDSDSDLRFLPQLESQVDRLAWARAPRRGIPMAARVLSSLVSGQSLSQGLLHDATLQNTIADWFKSTTYQAVVCTAAAMASYLAPVAPLWSGRQRPRLLMDFIDVDSAKWTQYAQRSRGPMHWVYAREAERIRALEQSVLETFDACFLVTPQEVRLLDPQALHSKLQACGNGVDLDFFHPDARLPESVLTDSGLGAHPSRPGGPWIVFTGVMDYLPNIDGVQWFVANVWPAILAAVPDARMAIVGARPTAEVRALSNHPGVVVTGFVEDVRLWLRAAAVCVAPLRIARGIQNKVLEAMAMGKAVVCTPESFEGIEANAQTELRVASTAPAFAKGVVNLLAQPELAQAMGWAARQRVEASYRWDQQLRPLREALE